MKKYLLGLIALLGIIGLAKAADWATQMDAFELIQISTQTIGNKVITHTVSATIPKPGSGNRNCLTEITATANNSISIYILDGPLTAPTTLFTTIISSGVPYLEMWSPFVPLCGEPNSTMTVTSALYGVSGSTVQINLSGFKRSR